MKQAELIWEQAILRPETGLVHAYGEPQDWRDYDAIVLDVWIPVGQTAEITANVEPLRFGRPEYVPAISMNALAVGSGWTEVELAFRHSDAMGFTSAMWRLIAKVELKARLADGDADTELAVRRVRLTKLGRIALEAPCLSRSGEPGETLSYELTVENLTDAPQAVVLQTGAYGFESMPAKIEPAALTLEAGAKARVMLITALHDGIPQGGYEPIELRAMPNGDADSARELVFYAVRKLPHPYIFHTEDGWEGVRRHVLRYDWAKEELASLVRQAEAWEVPETAGAGRPYAYELTQRFNLHAAAVAWKLTGRRDFLDKAVLFLRRFADPVNGYPATDAPYLHIYASREEMELATPRGPKVCTGGLIHEGEFMLTLSSCYDLLYDADSWSPEDRIRMENALRLYMDKVDWMITDGDTNNIPSGGMAGALLCSLVLQDMHGIKRFIEGPGGLVDMLRTGVMDDGWYFEGAGNYVLLFADMFARLAQAAEPWGLNLKQLQVSPSYRKDAMLAPWSLPQAKSFLGMSFRKFGPVRRNVRSIKDVWDAMLPFTDERGILVGNNDSTDKDMARSYDLAYYVWRDPRYVSVIRRGSGRDLLYGLGELPEPPEEHYAASAYADNVGLAVLRSRKPGRQPGEQLQAVLKYGSHGGYHGHFDRAGLVSVRRYGKNAYGPLASWFGYHSFMFKMWVQASMSHNMVVVDQRMQEPVESRRLLFHSGDMVQICAVETAARWMDPPYGGQTPYPESFPQERGLIEGRELPQPAIPRAQGETGEYSERIVQRRLMAVTDDYVLIADYLRGEEEHVYDCLYHFQGFTGLDARQKTFIRHTGKLNDDPYGAAQFITDCDWYECQAPVAARFSHNYGTAADDRDGRHMLYQDEGRMDTELHLVWPPEATVVTGRYAEASGVNKTLEYQVLGDGKTLAGDRFGAWILGKRQVIVSLRGVEELTLKVQVDRSGQKTVFWDDPSVILEDGRRLHVSELEGIYRNVDPGNGIGTDYEGGPVHLEGEPAVRALPFEPLDHREPAEAVFDLRGLGAVAFEGVIGGDYPVGDDPARRKTVSFRTCGKTAWFMTLLELHEGGPAMLHAEAAAAGRLSVRLSDGRRQELVIRGLDSEEGHVAFEMEEWSGERLLRME
ncbi:Heparinase II/III-like protein [Paenibacillus sp. UNCCL117]|uniref:COG1470 family protein n=1 Tax=unclassified Paenibacillus TaxID=185978 RepID=UPI00088E4189|nr:MULTISPECIES: heparinase II/III family protein [unclassified Paenibacillus]SDD07080.1 Heparinase II/III-like protein [Paenibacillus sp. cl123]SFW31559.1 Heparinase II/III-like protein [Paenibacillus sp. UNCCL117]